MAIQLPVKDKAANSDIETATENIREVAARFAEQRSERQRRRELDPADFDQLREAGLLLMSVPVEYGGLWESMTGSARPLAEMYRILAQGDPSVALVASMHPAILTGGFPTDVQVPPAYHEAWEEQKRWAYQTALDGAWWGTIASEPGSGGDMAKTKAVCRRGPSEGEYRISGLKHFGSGCGVLAFMNTAAVPEGEQERARFILDMRGMPLDGSAGARLVAAWDGQGMTATQSHTIFFEDFPAQRWACPQHVLGGDRSVTMGNIFWTAIALGIVETALETARDQLAGRNPWRAYEQVEWSRSEVEAWLIEQAYEGMLRSVEQEGGRATSTAKTAVAELAESVLQRLCRVVGGGTYSRQSPFGFWFEDVRALGFLRPPWGLAYDRLFEASWPARE